MKYKIGQEFLLQTSLGTKKTYIVDIKYEFADYIKGGPKYVNEKEVEAYMNSRILVPSRQLSEKEKDIKELEKKYGIRLAEVDSNGNSI